MSVCTTHRLDGLEPDNLLAFMALLGLLRAFEKARPEWRVRIFWTIDEPILRPTLRVPQSVDENAVVAAVAKGLSILTPYHDFGDRRDLLFKTTASDKAEKLVGSATIALRHVANEDRYVADLWGAMVSDAAIARDCEKAEPTPLCFIFGQGHQHFLKRLASVPKKRNPPDRGKGRNKQVVSEEDCLYEALFKSWRRLDKTDSFRWDPHEDVRYAYRARNPTDRKTKETTQHGANRLAALGFSILTVVPTRLHRSARVQLAMIGGRREVDGTFSFRWPIWQAPISLACIRALLSHPNLNNRQTRDALGIVQILRARRISSGKYINITRATSEAVSSRACHQLSEPYE